MNKEFQVDAFVFTTKEDADRALKEKKQIEYIKNHLDMSSVENVKGLYEKANRERLFRTPIGLAFMQELYNALLKYGVNPDDLLPVFVQATFEQRLRPRTTPEKMKEEFKEKQSKLIHNYRISFVLNIVLIIAVIFMFAITIKSDNPNILNYESALQDKYSSWEQDLSQREAALKEKELQITRSQE